MLVNATFDGAPVFLRGPELEVWRAPTDNDGIKLWANQEHKFLGIWRKAGYDSIEVKSSECEIRTDNSRPLISFTRCYRCAGSDHAFEWRGTYRFPEANIIDIDSTVECDPSLPHLPRIGLAAVLSPGYDRAGWYGNGPHENYSDRKTSAWVARFEATLDDLRVPYIMPQENGNRTDIRWLSISGAGGAAVTIAGNPLFEFSAHHYTTDDFYRTTHDHELKSREETYLHLVHKQCGLGTGSCGPATLERYLVPAGRFRFAFRIVFGQR